MGNFSRRFKDDILRSILQTEDGGYVAAGFSSSDDGNVSDNNGGSDAWTVRLDPFGNLLWETNLGGPGGDIIASLDQTSDLGYIMAGYTSITEKK